MHGVTIWWSRRRSSLLALLYQFSPWQRYAAHRREQASAQSLINASLATDRPTSGQAMRICLILCTLPGDCPPAAGQFFSEGKNTAKMRGARSWAMQAGALRRL
jgi:hypothetical protein